ncbi:CHAP domain-containing protein [Sphingobium sp. CAP-1]|uniref:CHAP domain-containing protein n=1 Tax=Sphingobium sp. CAP-1 TaxID=2676077 RepID=UPI0012BB3B29|nr:CHAP domain-containing protein [Sphingobium sp. CAP-1]QGP79291.1 CHAP domain-containing protein [Sphingobium sp. CAP-1]
MFAGFRAFFAASVLALSAFVAVPATAGTLQCAPFARQVSGIDLHGNANTWWGQADGRYDRGHEPRVGAVLAFASSRSMPVGHVAMVSKVVGDREVLLTHANWSYRGGIERDVRAIDVSPNNDWTDVRVWYGPIGGLGLRSNPAKGFIYASAPKAAEPMPVRIAMAENTGAAARRAAF